MRDFASSSDPAVQAQLDRLAALTLPRGRLSLDPVRALLARLGDPHRALPPVFHVAGTNGKGSTAAFLRAMLEAQGCRVHVYTSPHLVRFNERIRLAGRLIEDAALAPLLADVLDAGADIGASFFEVTTAAALLAFARDRADACVIEVGLGGRFDATNVIETPAVCGIASLGIDHEAFLLAPEDNAPTEPRARIAWEKAGIAKPGAPLVTQAYAPVVASTIAEVAAARGATLIARGDGWSVDASGEGLRYRDRLGSVSVPRPTMPGLHQADNAGLALAMLRHQTEIPVTIDAMASGVPAARWPARLARLGDGPLTRLAPGRAMWLDGGHNRDAGEALAEYFAAGPTVHLLIGMLAAKDARAIIGPLARNLASVTALPIEGHEAHPPEVFERLALEFGVPFRSAAQTIDALSALTGPGDVLVAGSLYLAGLVLAANDEIPD